MTVDRPALVDRPWTAGAALAGLGGIVSYGLLATLPASAPVSALLTSLFSLGFMGVGIGVFLGVTRRASPRIGLLSAVANTVAGAELMAMLLVQIAVKTAVPRPGAAMTGIWLGLDVAWDVFGAVGTVLMGLALWYHGRFRILAATGALAGAVLLALNVATFPTPPAEAGLVDVGPVVALWYVALCARLLLVARSEARQRQRPEVDSDPVTRADPARV